MKKTNFRFWEYFVKMGVAWINAVKQDGVLRLSLTCDLDIEAFIPQDFLLNQVEIKSVNIGEQRRGQENLPFVLKVKISIYFTKA